MLLYGDCLQLMQQIPDHSIDMVCCDMPFGTTRCKWDSVIDLRALWREYLRVTKPNAAILLFAQTPFDKVLGCSNLPMLRYEIIWEKTSATGHLNAKRAPMKAHENILVFYSKQPVYNPQKTSGHKRKSALNVDRATKQSACYGKQSGITHYDSTERYPRSVLLFKSDKQNSAIHPTQKPIALCEYLIRTYSNEGDTVLDNCMGSGTTGVACVRLNRAFIGIELERHFYDIANVRIASATQR